MLTQNIHTDFNQLLDESGVIFWQTKDNGRCLSLPAPWNENNPVELTVSDWSQQVHPKDIVVIQNAINSSNEREDYQIDYRIKQADGSFTWVREMAKRKRDNSENWEGFIHSIEEMKTLEIMALSAAEEEKRFLGRELHDDLCQQLAGMLFFTNNLMSQINSEKSKESLLNSALEIKNQLKISIDKTRSLSHGLNLVNLETQTFKECLTTLIQQIETLYSIKCNLDIGMELNVANPKDATHLFRITQESINNAVRHGRANVITITLQSQNDFGILKIRDNGSGINPDKSHSQGMGLRNLKFRAQSIGASIELRNHSEGGAQLQCKFPSSLF